jgi:hypothetical protein
LPHGIELYLKNYTDFADYPYVIVGILFTGFAAEGSMDKTELRNKANTLGVLESSILSAHMIYFKGNSESHYRLKDEESVIFETVMKYFEVKS